MKTLAQTFLETQTLERLFLHHGVRARWSTKRPGVVSLNYDQIKARDADHVSQQCRGLILRREGGQCGDAEIFGASSIVARPFDRFFDIDSAACAPIDFETAKLYEKLDGTLCIVHYDLGEWHVATRAVPDADVAIHRDGPTFRELFQRTLGAPLGEGLDERLTYLYELTTRDNRIVCAYDTDRLWLLGARSTTTGREFAPSECLVRVGVSPCPWLTFADGDHRKWLDLRDPSRYEGAVLCDAKFRRAKIKSSSYKVLSRMVDAIKKSPRAMMEIALGFRSSEVAHLLSEHDANALTDMENRVAVAFSSINDDFAELGLATLSRKDAALCIKERCPQDMTVHMDRLSCKCTDAYSWVRSKRLPSGGFSDSFLDSWLDRIAWS